MSKHNQPKRKARPPTPYHIIQSILAYPVGTPQKAIAEELSIAQPTVSKIMRRHGLARYQKKPKQTT